MHGRRKKPKNMLPLNILDILKKRTDENHRLSQNEIEDILLKDYGTKVGRKTIKRNLMNLIEFGYDIDYTETPRKSKSGEEYTVCTGWYLRRDISDAELSVLIDSLLFSKYIPYNHGKLLVNTLEGLASQHFRHRCNLPGSSMNNPEFLLTVELLNEGIVKNRQLVFNLVTYGTDKKSQLVLGPDGIPREYCVSPYEIVVVSGRHYLLCAHSKGGLFNYFIDRIRGIKILEEYARRPIKNIAGYEQGLDLQKFMAEHPFMYSGKSERVFFRADKTAHKFIVGHILDTFGNDVRFSDETEKFVTASVTVNEQAMLYWAFQFGNAIEILQPKDLREKARSIVKKIWQKYAEE